MGCCDSKLLLGEEYIRRKLQDIDLWDKTYLELKSDLIKYSVDFTINKTELKNNILDPLVKCEEHRSIFNFILSKLDENCSIYYPLFYLFTFLSHTTGATEFFEVIFQINEKPSLSLEDIKKHTLNFYKFTLISVTEQIYEALSKSKLDENKKKILDDIKYSRETVFNESNIEIEVENFINIFKKNEKCNNTNSPFDFASICDSHLYFHNFDVRDYFYFKYSEK